MESVNTSLTVINETDVRGHALFDLIKSKISFGSTFYGFKPIGTGTNIQFPVLFVEPKSQFPFMDTTAKFEIKIMYGIYWYVRDNDSEAAVKQSSFIAESLIKLFSNNALGDLQSANPPSNKFKQYPSGSTTFYWLDSEMKEIRWSVNYLDPEVSGGMKYERAGRMMLEIMDIILK